MFINLLICILWIFRHSCQRNWGLFQEIPETRWHWYYLDQSNICWTYSSCYRCPHFASASCTGNPIQGSSVRCQQGFHFEKSTCMFTVKSIGSLLFPKKNSLQGMFNPEDLVRWAWNLLCLEIRQCSSMQTKIYHVNLCCIHSNLNTKYLDCLYPISATFLCFIKMFTKKK